jgi:hypothetical protein
MSRISTDMSFRDPQEALEADDLVVCEPVRAEEPDRSEKG